MKGTIALVGQKTVYNNKDSLSVDIDILRASQDPNFPQLLEEVQIQLICKGNFGSNIVRYFTSEPQKPKMQYTMPEQMCLHADLQFPEESLNVPSTLQFQNSSDGVEWYVLGTVRSQNGDVLYIQHPCTFVQSSASQITSLPSLSQSSFIPFEVADRVDNSEVNLLALLPAVGLPQAPYETGIKLQLECSKPGKFVIMRSRVYLKEVSEVTVNDSNFYLPNRYWELCTYEQNGKPIFVDHMHTDLTSFVGDLSINYMTMPPSFITNELNHSFNLVVDITLADLTNNEEITIIFEIRDVKVQPKLNCMDSSGMFKPSIYFDVGELSDESSSSSISTTSSNDSRRLSQCLYTTRSGLPEFQSSLTSHKPIAEPIIPSQMKVFP